MDSRTQTSVRSTPCTSARATPRWEGGQSLLSPHPSPPPSPGSSPVARTPTSTAPTGPPSTSVRRTPAGCWSTARWPVISVDTSVRIIMFTVKTGLRWGNVPRILNTWTSTVQRYNMIRGRAEAVAFGLLRMRGLLTTMHCNLLNWIVFRLARSVRVIAKMRRKTAKLGQRKDFVNLVNMLTTWISDARNLAKFVDYKLFWTILRLKYLLMHNN